MISIIYLPGYKKCICEIISGGCLFASMGEYLCVKYEHYIYIFYIY